MSGGFKKKDIRSYFCLVFSVWRLALFFEEQPILFLNACNWAGVGSLTQSFNSNWIVPVTTDCWDLQISNWFTGRSHLHIFKFFFLSSCSIPIRFCSFVLFTFLLLSSALLARGLHGLNVLVDWSERYDCMKVWFGCFLGQSWWCSYKLLKVMRMSQCQPTQPYPLQRGFVLWYCRTNPPRWNPYRSAFQPNYSRHLGPR